MKPSHGCVVDQMNGVEAGCPKEMGPAGYVLLPKSRLIFFGWLCESLFGLGLHVASRIICLVEPNPAASVCTFLKQLSWKLHKNGLERLSR